MIPYFRCIRRQSRWTKRHKRPRINIPRRTGAGAEADFYGVGGAGWGRNMEAGGIGPVVPMPDPIFEDGS
jgi:hypothetical protein